MNGDLNSRMKVLALTKYGTLAASTRQRFLQYVPALASAGIELNISPLLDNDYLKGVLVGRSANLGSILKAYIRRLKAIGDAQAADVIWLHCEFLPYWPSLAEGLAARLVSRPIVFDFDDAIFHMYDNNAAWATRFLLEGKLEGLLRRVQAAACGNDYLQRYAARFCPNSIVLPTVVDTAAYRPRQRRKAGPVTIGWIGSPSTWPNVRPLLPLLAELARAHQVRIRVVGAGTAAEADRFEGLDLVEWNEASEIAEVQAMDIGIMPLADRPFERGKSGYKLVQYMACGLPVVASPVGVNREMVRDDVNGFLADSNAEWRVALARLVEDVALRRELGKAGRMRVERLYSLASQAPRLVALLRAAASA